MFIMKKAASLQPLVPVARPAQRESDRNSILRYNLSSQTRLCAAVSLVIQYFWAEAVPANDSSERSAKTNFLFIFEVRAR